jgi:hypothetical protein
MNFKDNMINTMVEALNLDFSRYEPVIVDIVTHLRPDLNHPKPIKKAARTHQFVLTDFEKYTDEYIWELYERFTYRRAQQR